MNKTRRIRFQVGGPSFHPVADQAKQIVQSLGMQYDCEIIDGRAAFENLDGCDLLVVMGMHWTGMKQEYQPLQDEHKQALEQYAASGQPILSHHGGIASYDDWTRFSELVGFQWVWGTTTHSPLGTHTVRTLPTGHPIVAGVKDYTLFDELYYKVRVADGLNPRVHAEAEFQDQRLPMVLTASRRAYLANGHDLRAFECPAMKQMWVNAVNWLFGKTQ